MCPRYDIFRCLTISISYRCNVGCWLDVISPPLDMCSVHEILKNLRSVHISKASILLRDLTLSDQISIPYNSIGYT